MKNVKRIVIISVLVMVMVLAMVIGVCENSKKELKQKAEEYATLEKDYEEVKKQLDQANVKLEKHETLEKEYEEVKKQLDQANIKLADHKALEKEYEEVKKQLDQANIKLDDHAIPEKEEEESEFSSIKFWADGNQYRVSDVKFYKNCYCSEQIDKKDLKIISPVVDYVQLENGMTVYAIKSEIGLVWCTEEPWLEVIE